MTAAFTGVMVIVAATAVESVAQLCLKLGASSRPAGPGAVVDQPGGWKRRLPPSAWVGCGVAAYAGEIALYTAALHFLDVSVAFPLSSLCFVGVTVLSRFVLGESVNRIRWLGVGLIIAGSALLTC